MNKTPLYEEHLRLGAKMVDFAGWLMPVLYTSILEEHRATRTAAGIFDVSHMGQVVVRGSGSGAFLRRMVPTNISRLTPGRCMYSLLCNETGGVVDDIFIYMHGPLEYLLVVNAGTREKDLDWLRAHAFGEVEIIDVSDATAKIDVQGPRAHEIVAQVFGDERIAGLPRFSFIQILYRDEPVIVSSTGYTGERGCEIYLDAAAATGVWRSLLDAGAPLGLLPAGLGARDTLRLESCYSLYGHEMNDSISPIEAGLGWLVSSGEEYIGRSALEAQKRNGAPRTLVCLELTDRGVPRDGYRVEAKGAPVGVVSSGAFSPTLQKGLALALVSTGSLSVGDEAAIVIRDKRVPAKVVKRPFYAFHG